MGCQACIKLKLKNDGTALEVIKLNEDHSHAINQESFQHLSHQRRLDDSQKKEVKQLLDLKVNKKMLQDHIHKSLGKIVTLKDIHNANKKEKTKNVVNNDLKTFVDEMKKDEGSVVELVVNDKSELNAVFFTKLIV